MDKGQHEKRGRCLVGNFTSSHVLMIYGKVFQENLVGLVLDPFMLYLFAFAAALGATSCI